MFCNEIETLAQQSGGIHGSKDAVRRSGVAAILITKENPAMNSRALALASTLYVVSKGVASADDMKPNDYNPLLTPLHNSQQGCSATPGSRSNAGGMVRADAEPIQEVQTHRLPHELQWMNRPHNLSDGVNW